MDEDVAIRNHDKSAACVTFNFRLGTLGKLLNQHTISCWNEVFEVISANKLFSIRRKALRRKVWFKGLDREERMIVSLTIRCVKQVRSILLVKIMTSIMNKLVNAMKTEIVKFVESAGSSLAGKMADIAVSWGNSQAKEWASDMKFAGYLAIMKLNIAGIFKA